jgi:predicted DNA binding CopG/RHH family protein
MSERTRKYSEGEIGDIKIVEDFLPRPDQLVLREDNVKVTLSLSRRSVEFFKREADQARVPYQRMIRALVHIYATQREKGLISNRAKGSREKGRRQGTERLVSERGHRAACHPALRPESPEHDRPRDQQAKGRQEG